MGLDKVREEICNKKANGGDGGRQTMNLLFYNV
jgi:hypothetical protein